MVSSGHSVQSRQRLIPQNTASLRRWRTPAEDENNWWSITFSDLVLLLLCFVVLWHLSEKRQLQSIVRSQEATILQQQSMQQPEEETIQFSDTTDMETTASLSYEDTEPPLELAAVTTLPTQSVSQTVSTTTSRWQELQSEITRYVHEQGLDRAVGVVSTEQGLVISLSDTITFPSGQATLNEAVTPLLAQVAALAFERPALNIEIAGHTDDRPISTPEFPSNWELSAARASRVARALLEQKEIDPTRISTRGFAHYRPLYANDTDEHRAANRRVELRLFRRVETTDEQSYE